MYAVEFQAPIENGIVHNTQKATFVIMYNDSANNTIQKDNEVQSQLQEFRRLRSQSNNKVMATMDLVTNIDAEMVDDGLF